MVNFTIDLSQFKWFTERVKDTSLFLPLIDRFEQEVYDEAIHFVHIDTGELLMSIRKDEPRIDGDNIKGEVYATSIHGVYEEARGGEHAFMSLAVQSAEVLKDNIVEEWWNGFYG